MASLTDVLQRGAPKPVEAGAVFERAEAPDALGRRLLTID